MKFSTIKYSMLIVLLAGFVAGCTNTSSNGTGSGSSSDNGSVVDDSVTTGTVDGSGISSSSVDDLAAKADTIFYFDFDKAVLKPEAKAALRIHADTLRNNPRSVRLEGHGDERGTREYNMALGERRAMAVQEFLTIQGVSGSILEVISYGEESPISLGSDEASWSVNRRVEMK